MLAVLAAVVMDRAAREPAFVAGGLLAIPALGWVATAIGLATGMSTETLQLDVFGPLATALTVVISMVGLLRPYPNPPGRGLWAAAFVYAGTAVLLDALFASHLDQTWLLLLLVITALWRAPRIDEALVVGVGKVVVALSLLLSVASVLAGYESATESYGTLLPVDFRVGGVFGHPNHLGPAALLYLILEWIRPSRLWVRRAMGATAGGLLVLSQSKTAWIAAVFAIAVLYGWRHRRGRLVPLLTLVGTAGVLALVLSGVTLDDVVDAQQAENIQNLTGRTGVWEVGVEHWRANPWFGAGPDVFRDYAERTGRPWAGQAHNQLIETVATHGALGLVTLLGYVLAVGVLAWRHADRSSGASLALVGALLLRSITETPLDAPTLEHLFAVALLFAWEREERQAGGSTSSDARSRRAQPARVAAGTG